MFLRIVSVCSLLVLLFAANITGEETKTPEDYFFEKNPELRLKYNLYPTSFDFVNKHNTRKYYMAVGVLDRVHEKFAEVPKVDEYLVRTRKTLEDDQWEMVIALDELRKRFSAEGNCYLYWFEHSDGQKIEFGVLALRNGQIIFRENYW